MSGGEKRRTDKSILVRCTSEEYETIKRAMEASMGSAPAHATSTVPRFVLQAALKEAASLLAARPAKSKR